MKIVSEYKELEGRVFNTVGECAEAEGLIEVQRAELAEKKKKNESSLRKHYSSEIDKADKDLKEAYDNYDKAKEEVRKILEKSNEEMVNILTPAEDKVREAQKAKQDAILKYNEHCGPYQAVYTGDRARQEYNRVINEMNHTFNSFWKNFFRF